MNKKGNGLVVGTVLLSRSPAVLYNLISGS